MSVFKKQDVQVEGGLKPMDTATAVMIKQAWIKAVHARGIKGFGAEWVDIRFKEGLNGIVGVCKIS